MNYRELQKNEVIAKIHATGVWYGFLVAANEEPDPGNLKSTGVFHEITKGMTENVMYNLEAGQVENKFSKFDQLIVEYEASHCNEVTGTYARFWERKPHPAFHKGEKTDFRVVNFLDQPLDMTITHVYEAEFFLEENTVATVTLRERAPLPSFKVVPAAAAYVLADDWDAVKIRYKVESVFLYSEETFDRGDEERGEIQTNDSRRSH